MFIKNNSVSTKFGSSSDLILENNGIITSYGYLTDFKDFNIGSRLHQTRNMGEDKQHIADLEGSIISKGLEFIPTVEYDGVTNTYNVLGGHHRIQAINNLRKDKENKFFVDGFPVVVAAFNNPNDRENFCQSDNNHSPAKPHCKKDAVDSLIRRYNLGHFNGMTQEQTRQEVTNLVKKYHQTLKTTSISEVYKKFQRALGKSSKIRFLIKSDVKVEADSIWNLNGKFNRSGQLHPNMKNTYIVCSVPTAADKAIFNILADNCMEKNKNTNQPISKIEVALYWDRIADVTSLQNQRAYYLEKYAAVNKHNKNIEITKIVFINQVQLPNPEPRTTKTWDNTEMKFV